MAAIGSGESFERGKDEIVGRRLAFRFRGKSGAERAETDGEPCPAPTGSAVLPEMVGLAQRGGKIGFATSLEAEEREGSGFRVGRQLYSEGGLGSIVPPAVAAAATENHAFAEDDAAVEFGAGDLSGGLLEGDERVGGGFNPGGGFWTPRPTAELQIVPGGRLIHHSEKPGEESGFRARSGEQPINALAKGGVVNFVGAMERDREGGGPVGFRDVAVGLPCAVFALPGPEEPPAFLPCGRLVLVL